MQIKLEDFSARNVMNFYPDTPFFEAEKAFVYNNKTLTAPTIVKNILSLKGVVRCLAARNILSVKWENDADIADLKTLILAEIDDYFAEKQAWNDERFLPPKTELFEAVADAFIRPFLYRDKGDIDIIAYNKGVLEIRFTGHCAGCPYAQNTLNNLIAKVYKKYIPEIKEINVKD